MENTAAVKPTKKRLSKVEKILIVTIAGLTVITLILIPRTHIEQQTRSLSIVPGLNDFIVSPAKVYVSLPLIGESVSIPVTIANGAGETVYNIFEQNPPSLDNGFTALSHGYTVAFDKASLDLQSGESGQFNIVVTKTAFHGQSHFEQGILIAQTVTNNQGIAIARDYYVEIEN